MADPFLQGIFADFIRGVSSPITSNVGTSASLPANVVTTASAAVTSGGANVTSG